MERSVVIGVALAAAFTRSLTAQQAAPAGWTWVFDRSPAPDSAFSFVMMPPGYHVTTGPAATLFHPAYHADGIYTLESEIFAFPSASDEEYGVFIGGTGLEADGRGYTAFVARRDGSAAVLRRSGETVTPLVAWARHDSVNAVTAAEPVKNVLRVAVDRATVVFTVNGAEVARVPRDSVTVAGAFGFRMGRGMNVHVTTLDYTQRLAPPRRGS